MLWAHPWLEGPGLVALVIAALLLLLLLHFVRRVPEPNLEWGKRGNYGLSLGKGFEAFPESKIHIVTLMSSPSHSILESSEKAEVGKNGVNSEP